jgi:hypothetical protein
MPPIEATDPAANRSYLLMAGPVYMKKCLTTNQFPGWSPHLRYRFPSALSPFIVQGYIREIGQDLRRLTTAEIKEGSAGAVRRRVNVALKSGV